MEMEVDDDHKILQQLQEALTLAQNLAHQLGAKVKTQTVREFKPNSGEEITSSAPRLATMIAEMDSSIQAFSLAVREFATHSELHLGEMNLEQCEKKQNMEQHGGIIHLEGQLNPKQAVEQQIEDIHRGDDNDFEVLEELEDIQKELREKEEEVEYLNALTQLLFVREQMLNVELQDARKELINGLKWPKLQSCKASLCVKTMGELDMKPFCEAMKRKYDKVEAANRSLELYTLWATYIGDPNWHPFRIINVDGKDKEVIDERDQKLNDLKAELGDEVYKAVTKALMEVNVYNPSGRRPTPELQEGVAYLLKLKQYKIVKRARKTLLSTVRKR